MNTKNYNLSTLNQGLTSVVLNYTSPLVIVNSFYDLGDDVIINKATISLYFSIVPSGPLNLYYVDSNNNDVFLDQISMSNNIGVFDFTRYLHVNKSALSNLKIKVVNQQTSATISLVNSSIEIEYLTLDECRPSNETLKNDLNDTISYSFNVASDNVGIRKKLTSKILPYDVSLYFNNFNCNCEHLFFPKGWKLNLLDYLDISIDNLGQKDIVYFDPYNKEHIFYRLFDNQNNVIAYYTKDGSALILEEYVDNNDTFYRLSTKLGTSYKKFDSYGRVIKIQGQKTKEVIEFSYDNGIDIVDYRDNEITITNNNNVISISINGDLQYSITKNNSDQLSSISINNNVSSFLYDSRGRIKEIYYNSQQIFDVSYSNSGVTDIFEEFGGNITKHYIVTHDYFKTYVEQQYGAKYFYYFDKELKLVSKGESLDGVDNVFALDTHEMEVEDAYFAISNLKANRYKENIVSDDYDIELNQSSDSLEIKQLYYFLNPITGFSFIKNKRYILIATLEKDVNQNIALSSTREAYITIKFGNNTEDRFDFDPYLQKQTIAIPFIAKKSENPVVKVCAQGMYSFGGVTISNVMIASSAGQASTYYASKKSGDGLSVVSGASSFSKDSKTWYQVNMFVDNTSNPDDIVKYSFDELKRNYIGVIKGSNYYWSDNFTRLHYSPSGGNNGPSYRFKNKDINISNINNSPCYARKTLITRKSDKQKYNFEYLEYDFSSQYFKYVKIYHNGSTDFKITKKYDLNLRLIEEVDEKHNSYKVYQYDNDGNIVKVRTRNSSGNKYIDTDFDYDLVLRNISQDDGITSTSFLYLDGYDILSETIDDNNVSESYEYNDELSKLTHVEKNNSEINNEYNTNGLLTSTSNDSEINFSYDSYGFNTNANVDTSSEGLRYLFNSSRSISTTKTVTYDDLEYQYNKYDYVKKISQILIDPQTNNSYTETVCDLFYYDSRPDDIELIAVDDESDLSSSSKLYVVRDYFSNRKSLYTYDSDDQITELKVGHFICDTGNSADSFTFLYKWSLEYDAYNRLSNITVYLSDNSLTFLMYSYNTTYTYEDECTELLTKIVNYVRPGLYNGSHGKTRVDYSWDDLLRPQNITYTIMIYDSGTSQWSTSHKHRDVYNYYDINNYRTTPLISRVDYKYYYSSWSNLRSTYYSYDNLGRISSIRYGTASVQNNNSGVSYSYDSCDRISSETNIEYGYQINYSYDNNGNILSVTKIDLNNPNSSPVTISYGYDQTYKDLLTSYKGATISYDDKLRPISYGNYAFSWSKNQLSSITIGGQTISFSYGYDGIRTKKIYPDQTVREYVLNGRRIVAEKITKPDNSVHYITYLYDSSGIYGITYNNAFYTLKRNILGDIDCIYKKNNLIARYIYDAYGNHKIVDKDGLEITDDPTHVAMVNPFRYRGYYYDVETGLYYCNSRYYNPEWGRWISPDTTSNIEPNSIDGINLYAYCKNNPIKYTDPDGTFEIFAAIIGAIIGAVVAIASLAISDAINGNTFDIRKYLIAGLFGAITGFLTGGFSNVFLTSGISATSTFCESLVQSSLDGEINTTDDFWKSLGKAIIHSSFNYLSSMVSSFVISKITKLDTMIKTGVVAIELSIATKNLVGFFDSSLRTMIIYALRETIAEIFDYIFDVVADGVVEIFYGEGKYQSL